MNDKVIKYLPAILIEIFIGMTYFLYRCGAWMYPYRKDNLTLIFMLACLGMFAIGYWWQNRRGVKMVEKKIQIGQVAKVIISINLLLMIPYCLCRTGYFIPHIFEVFQNLSAAYARATEASGSYGALHTIVGIGTPLIYIVYHVIYFYWEELDIKVKLIGLFECIWYCSVDMCTGRNKGITTICIMIVIMYFIKVCDKEYSKQKKAVLLRTVITIFIIIMVPLYFSKSMSDRGNNSVEELKNTGKTVKEIVLGGTKSYNMIVEQYGYKEPEIEENDSDDKNVENIDYDEYNVKVTPGKISQKIFQRYKVNEKRAVQEHPYYADEFSYSYVNINDPVYKFLPGKMKYAYVMASNYISHGYHGLTLALRLPFDSCFGIGHLPVLQNQFKNITGIDIYKRSYVYKLNQAGYPVSLKWGTAFLQWASDISFVGVVFLMGLFGALVGRLWNEVLLQKNIISLILLTTLSVNILFITSWWQPGMSGTDFILFYGVLAVWIVQKVVTVIKSRKSHI